MDLGEEKLDETLEKVAPNETNVFIDGELDLEGIRDREDRSVSPSEAVASSPGNVMMSKEDLSAGVFISASLTDPVESSTSATGSTSAIKKGYGLKKKWRRIRRNLNKDETGGGDSGLILKRRLSLPEAPKAREDHKFKGEDEAKVEAEAEVSIASVDSNVLVSSVPMVPTSLDPELGFLAAAGFAVGIDSENSEDYCSKSLTAASAPKLRYQAIGFGRERNRARGAGGRGSVQLAQQRGQRTRGGVDTNRWYVEGQNKTEKENSYSSVESDLRSSSANFAHWGSVTSDVKKSEKTVSYDGEHSDDGQPGDEVQSSYHKENGRTGNLLTADLDGGILEENVNIRSDNSQSESNFDPFLASVASLKEVQEALENEIQKFEEVRKEAAVDDSLCEGTEGSSSPTTVAHFSELNRRIEQLELKLEEALSAVKTKESKILMLETLVNNAEFSKKEEDPFQDKCKKLEIDLESMLVEKMEAEVKYLMMTRTTQCWKVLAEDQIALSEEQNILSRSLSEFKLKLREAEEKSINLKVDVENLEDKCKEMQKGQEVLRFRSEVCKYSICLLIQIIVLLIVLVLFLVQLLSSPLEVVPT